jgi:N-acetylmuramic acid 6-phosphate etherase
LAEAAELIADRLRAGGRLLFAGAGTSGRLAWAEAAELAGTFGLDPARVRAVVAGGVHSTDSDEDDLDLAAADLDALRLNGSDVLVTVAASGGTPYTLAVAETARRAGVAVIAVVNAPETPLAALADQAVELPPAAEVLQESTRLTAGTMQKVALNALTTAAMARLGRVHDDLMIDMVAANAKLRRRQTGIVAEIAGCSLDAAADALAACADDARAAVVHLVLGLAPAEARARAARFITLRDTLASKS